MSTEEQLLATLVKALQSLAHQVSRLNDNIEAEKAVKEETWRPTDYRED